MSSPAADEVMGAIANGEDFRIESEDANLMDFQSGEQRHLCGVRVYLRTEAGRWRKTGMWLVANVDAGRPNTNAEALAALVRGLTAKGICTREDTVDSLDRGTG